jgi:hypothetical protein
MLEEIFTRIEPPRPLEEFLQVTQGCIHGRYK